MTLEDLAACKNVPLKNMFAGRRCFLIGNGPSLKTQDITLLKNEVTVVASSFFRHPDAKVVNPPFWVFADPYFWTKPDTYFIPAFKYALEKGVTTRLFAPSGGSALLRQYQPGAAHRLPYLSLRSFCKHFDAYQF